MAESANHHEQPPKLTYNRRYVGVRETLAYLLNDVSNSFNIGQYNDRFIWDVVKIDFGVQAVVNIFTGIWDVINDSVIGIMVDKTRTRWGKFRPYLLGFQMPITLLGILYWCIPLFFPNSAATYMPKLVFYFLFGAIKETVETFTGVAKGGYMTTITPNPDERGRLILLAELFTGYMGEDMPNIIMGVLIDFVNNGVTSWKLQNVFLLMGILTATISTLFTLFFFLVSRERVPQSVDRPSIKEGFQAILNNRPVLMILLSRVLGGFSIGSGQQNYFIDVLGAASLQTIVNLPSSFVGSFSYALVQPLRHRYSSKALWVFEDLYSRSLWVIVFLLGLPNRNYQKRLYMSVLFGLQAFFDKWMFGIRKVINAELQNEAMDYCEWRNGYRVEATTSVAISLVSKVQTIAMNSVRQIVMSKIGYVQGRQIGTQSDNTKRWMFAMCTGVPVITGLPAVFPKFFYPLNQSMRVQMYNELHQRRSETAQEINAAIENG